MNIYRFTTKTLCGVIDKVVQNGNTLDEAKAKYFKHNALKHSPMQLLKIETKVNGYWETV